MTIVIFLLILTTICAGCLTREYTNQKGNATATPTPTQQPQGTAYEAIAPSRFGWVILEERDAIDLTSLPGGYVRQYPGNFLWQKVSLLNRNLDFSQTDAAVLKAQRMNKILVPQIWPLHVLDQSSCRPDPVQGCDSAKDDLMAKRGKENYLPPDRCMPCNMSEYRVFVESVVERYDGDGFSDMPGLVYPIKVWDFYDQPSLRTPQILFFGGTADEYIQLLEVTHEMMKYACEDCMLLHSTFAAFRDDSVEYWKGIYAATDEFELVNMQAPLVDVDGDLGIAGFKERFPGVANPIWITRTFFARRDKNDAMFTDQIVKSTARAFAAGAQRIFIGESEIYTHPQLLLVTRTMIMQMDGFDSVHTNSDGSVEFSFADGHKMLVAEGKIDDAQLTIVDISGNQVSAQETEADELYYVITS